MRLVIWDAVARMWRHWNDCFRFQCEYEGYPETSTMCVFQHSPDASDAGISADDIVTIVESHNNYRANVEPTAQNMQKMVGIQLFSRKETWMKF